jgi:thiamine transport system substrate-binding protein
MNLIRSIPAEGAMPNSGRASVLRRAFTVISLLFFLVLPFFGAFAEERVVVVYTYDSFVSDWGAGPKVAAGFEKATGIKVKFVSKGDGGQLLSSLILEKGKSGADVALGIDNFLAPKALASGLFSPYASPLLSSIPKELRFDPSNRLLPYDSGFFAIVWDSARLATPPKSLEELTKPEYAKKLILMDPRTSTPGLGFLAWTEAVYGPAWKDYWKRLKASVLTMTPGWDQGYGLFTSGEAPLVLSYAADTAYHLEEEKTERYKGLAFPEGGIRQIEAAGILSGAMHRANAEAFIDYLLSEECQNMLPLTQWMYPANARAKLPASYASVALPKKALSLDASRLAEDAVTAAEILTAKK